MHGPAELLPISSSAHINLIPWLLGWSYSELAPEQRKTFEVAVHAGTVAALTIRTPAWPIDRGRALRLVLSSLAPAAIGYALRGPIARRTGTPPGIAAGLIAGGLVMAAADRAPERRTAAQAGAIDALWLGAAQACALVPGISRSGATLTAARLRGFTRHGAAQLAYDAGLPVIAGAALLEAMDTGRRRTRGGGRLPIAGAGAAFASTWLARGWELNAGPRGHRLAGYSVYRMGVGLLTLIRWRRARRLGPSGTS